jgi:hypothetical protein
MSRAPHSLPLPLNLFLNAPLLHYIHINPNYHGRSVLSPFSFSFFYFHNSQSITTTIVISHVTKFSVPYPSSSSSSGSQDLFM